jgi:hypothetical protein
VSSETSPVQGAGIGITDRLAGFHPPGLPGGDVTSLGLVLSKERGKKDLMLRVRMRQITLTKVRYGMAHIFTLLRRECWPDNHKRVQRLVQAGRAKSKK